MMSFEQFVWNVWEVVKLNLNLGLEQEGKECKQRKKTFQYLLCTEL